MADFFISYAREDAEFARALEQRLEESEWDVWIDEKDIPPSVPWMTEIEHALNESMMMVAIESTPWLTSAACRIELDLAEQARMPIVRLQPDASQLDELARRLAAAFRELPPWRRRALEASSAAAIWDAAGRSKSLLVRGRPLRTMRESFSEVPEAFSPAAKAFLVASRQAFVRRVTARVVLGFIAPLLFLALVGSNVFQAVVNKQVATNVATATEFAERSTYADWNIYAGLERSPTTVDSYVQYYQLFSFLAERTPSAWDPAPVGERGSQTAVSPDRAYAASIDGAAVVVTTDDGATIRLLATAPVTALAWSPDSRWIAVATSAGADVISVDNARVIPLRGGSSAMVDVRWDSAADVVAGGSSGSGRWRVFDGSPVAAVDGVRFGTSTAGYLYSVSAAGVESKTDLDSGISVVLPDVLPAGSVPTTMDSKGSLVAVAVAAAEPFLRLIDTSDDRFRDIDIDGCSPSAMSLSSDGAAAYLACSDAAANQMRVDLESGEIIAQPMQQQFAFGVRALDDRVLWGGSYSLVFESDLDLTPRGSVTITAGCGAPIRKLIGPSDGAGLFQIGDATGSFSCATRLDVGERGSGQAEVHRLIFPTEGGRAVPDAATSPDGSLVAYGLSDGGVRVFTTDDFYPVYFAQVLPDQIRSVTFSVDGSRVIVAGAGGQIVALPVPSMPIQQREEELASDARSRLQSAIDWGIYASTMNAGQ